MLRRDQNGQVNENLVCQFYKDVSSFKKSNGDSVKPWNVFSPRFTFGAYVWPGVYEESFFKKSKMTEEQCRSLQKERLETSLQNLEEIMDDAEKEEDFNKILDRIRLPWEKGGVYGVSGISSLSFYGVAVGTGMLRWNIALRNSMEARIDPESAAGKELISAGIEDLPQALKRISEHRQEPPCDTENGLCKRYRRRNVNDFYTKGQNLFWRMINDEGEVILLIKRWGSELWQRYGFRKRGSDTWEKYVYQWSDPQYTSNNTSNEEPIGGGSVSGGSASGGSASGRAASGGAANWQAASGGAASGAAASGAAANGHKAWRWHDWIPWIH